MQNRQNDKQKLTMQIRVDSSIHHQLKVNSAENDISIKSLVEQILVESGICISKNQSDN